ncbi:MAG: DUF1499 domain-containing protein, partial [Oceanicaulis sp.]
MLTIFRIIRHLVVGLAATLAIGVPLWFVVTAFGGKFDVWTPLDAFRHVRSYAGILLPAAAVAGLAALVVAILFRVIFGSKNAPGPGGYIAGVTALAVGLGGIIYAQQVRAMASGVPPIHDISTDFENPPGFTQAMLDRRGPDSNPVAYEGKTVSDASWVDPHWAGRLLPGVQREAYPGVQPVVLDLPPQRAYAVALDTAKEVGWTVTADSERALSFEGTAETFWFGFQDDVSVRVTPAEDGGSRVDMRSISRVGMSDLGANAARLER